MQPKSKRRNSGSGMRRVTTKSDLFTKRMTAYFRPHASKIYASDHQAVVDIENADDEHKLYEDEIDEFIDEEAPISRSEAQINTYNFMQKPAVQVVMIIATFIALCFNDIRHLGLPKAGDTAIDVLLVMTLILFIGELIVCSWCQPKYFLGIFFWLDLMAAISICLDVPALNPFQTYEENRLDLARAGRAAKVGAQISRISKLLRFVRLLRVMRVFKLVKYIWDRIAKKDKENGQEGIFTLGPQVRERITHRVVCCVLFLVLTIPLLEIDLSGSLETLRGDSLRLLEASSSLNTTTHSQVSILAKEYESHYVDLVFLRVNGKIYKGTNATSFLDEFRPIDIIKHQGRATNTNAWFDNRPHNQESAAMSILLTLVVVVVLCSATMVITKDTETFVSIPMKNLLAQQKKLDVVMDIFKALHTEDEDAIDKIVNATHKLMNCESVFFYFINKVQGTCHLTISTDNCEIGRKVNIGQGIVGQVAESGRTINIMNSHTDDRFDAAVDGFFHFDARSMLTMSITDHHHSRFAVIQCINKQKNNKLSFFTIDDEEALSAFVSEIAFVLKQREREKVFSMVFKDEKGGQLSIGKIATREDRNKLKDFISQYTLTTLAHGSTDDGKKRSDTMIFGEKIMHHTEINASMPQVDIDTWDFDVWALSVDQLIYVIEGIFKGLGFSQRFNTSEQTVHNWISLLSENYQHDNYYHNFRHGFNIFHSCYLYLTTTSVGKILRGLDKYNLLLAAIAHDVGHPGTNNSFGINTKSDIAITYNDISILENYHAATMFKLTFSPESAVFSGLSPERYVKVRKTIVEAILGTDMVRHSEHVKWITSQQGVMANADPETCTKYLSCVLHCADVGNPTLPWRVASRYSVACAEEFKSQVAQERELGIPITSFMDISDEPALAKLNLGFIDYVVSPIWTVRFIVLINLLHRAASHISYIIYFLLVYQALVTLVPELQPSVDNIRSNRTHWEAIKAQTERINLPPYNVAVEPVPRVQGRRGSRDEGEGGTGGTGGI